jgi:hypothetical protein
MCLPKIQPISPVPSVDRKRQWPLRNALVAPGRCRSVGEFRIFLELGFVVFSPLISRRSCRCAGPLRGSSSRENTLIRGIWDMSVFWQKSRVDLIFAGFTMICHNCLNVNDFFCTVYDVCVCDGPVARKGRFVVCGSGFYASAMKHGHALVNCSNAVCARASVSRKGSSPSVFARG